MKKEEGRDRSRPLGLVVIASEAKQSSVMERKMDLLPPSLSELRCNPGPASLAEQA